MWWVPGKWNPFNGSANLSSEIGTQARQWQLDFLLAYHCDYYVLKVFVSDTFKILHSIYFINNNFTLLLHNSSLVKKY